MQNLKRFDFYENASTNSGAIALAAAIQVARALEHLDLRYNNIGPQGDVCVCVCVCVCMCVCVCVCVCITFSSL
jgi:hypothetical protein